MFINFFKAIAVASIFTIFANSANAAYHDDSGTATCYILKNNELVKKSECTYEGGIYTSVHEIRSEYNYQIKDYEDIYVTDLAHAVEGTKGGKILFNPSVIEIDNSPARYIYRDMKTLKPVSSSYEEGVLHCIQARSGILEICKY